MNSNSESGSFCNLNLEDSDLKKLEELDPFQTDGYQSTAKINVPIKIIYTSETGKETVDTQPLNIQILTRWLKPGIGKTRQTKNQAALESVRLIISSEDDIFLSFMCNFNNSTFEALKLKNQLNLYFNDFPNNIIGILKNCSVDRQTKKQQNFAEFRLSCQGTGKLFVCQQTEYKRIELLELFFTTSNIQKSHQSIIYRYNYNKTKLAMIENSIESIYKLLAVKNPPLLAYIQKQVGVE